MAMTIVGTNPEAVIGGVDTHADVHVAAAVNHVGGVMCHPFLPSWSTQTSRVAIGEDSTTRARGFGPAISAFTSFHDGESLIASR
jgi:hypothetical protein